jgi:hypothetical protein
MMTLTTEWTNKIHVPNHQGSIWVNPILLAKAEKHLNLNGSKHPNWIRPTKTMGIDPTNYI